MRRENNRECVYILSLVINPRKYDSNSIVSRMQSWTNKVHFLKLTSRTCKLMLREGATSTVGNLANCWFIWRNSHDGSKPEPTDFPEFFANSDAANQAEKKRAGLPEGEADGRRVSFLNLKLVPNFLYSHHFSCIIMSEWSMICLLGKNQVTNMTCDKGADLTNYLFDPRKNGVIPFFPLRLEQSSNWIRPQSDAVLEKF